jgi:hypothetical protein
MDFSRAEKQVTEAAIKLAGCGPHGKLLGYRAVTLAQYEDGSEVYNAVRLDLATRRVISATIGWSDTDCRHPMCAAVSLADMAWLAATHEFQTQRCPDHPWQMRVV